MRNKILICILALIGLFSFAPQVEAQSIKYPFGFADFQTVATATTTEITVSNGGFTWITLASNLTAATTINVTVAPSAQINGNMLLVSVPCGTSQFNVTWGSASFTAPTLFGVANTTSTVMFVYSNGKFVQSVAPSTPPGDLLTITVGTAVTVPITNARYTYARINGNLTANSVVTLTASDGAKVIGNEVTVEISSGATAFNATFDTVLASSDGLTGTINKTRTVTLVYNGTKFVEKAEGNTN